jgi:DNA-binding transcriptional regulator YhcF (GntR family)
MYVEILEGLNIFREVCSYMKKNIFCKHIKLTSKILSIYIMLEHKTGAPSADYAAKIPYFIIAALGLNETESVRSIARKTGFNPTTVSRYIMRLVKTKKGEPKGVKNE